jgi:hypothetical protein
MRSSRELHVVIVNYAEGSGTPVRIHVPPGLSRARVLTLSAPSLGAEGGVQLGGATVQVGGAFSESRTLPSVAARGRAVTVAAAPASAMLVTITP